MLARTRTCEIQTPLIYLDKSELEEFMVMKMPAALTTEYNQATVYIGNEFSRPSTELELFSNKKL